MLWACFIEFLEQIEQGKSDDEDLQEIMIRADRLKIPISVHDKVANIKPQPIAWDYHDLVNSCFLIHIPWLIGVMS